MNFNYHVESSVLILGELVIINLFDVTNFMFLNRELTSIHLSHTHMSNMARFVKGAIFSSKYVYILYAGLE